MDRAALTTYLNDHLAGSVGAIDLLDHLVERAPDPEAKRLFADVRVEVTQDQETLQLIIRRAGPTKPAGARLARGSAKSSPVSS